MDQALEAGVAEARVNLQTERERARQRLVQWAELWPGPRKAAQAVTGMQHRSEAGSGLSAEDRVTLIAAGGERTRVQEGVIPLAANLPDENSPPRCIVIETALLDGWRLELTHPVREEWREHAQQLESTLQVLRGLRAQRSELERSIWAPFLVIHGITLLAGIAGALVLARGVTRPVEQMLVATDAVARGAWDTQVSVQGDTEFTRLGHHFNRMVRQLDAQQRQLVDLEKMAGWREMARALAHEVKNPLTPIQLTVEEMRARYTGNDLNYRQILDDCTRIVVEEVDSLRNIVLRFREFSRPVDLRLQPLDLNRLVADIAALQRDLAVELHLDPQTGLVPLDADRMRQVLLNLTENARKAQREQPNPRLRLETRAGAGEVFVTVDDHGPGIPVADRERIFEPYYSGARDGLGLGLALVKGILLAHGGSVHAEAAPTGGARFVLRLPRSTA